MKNMRRLKVLIVENHADTLLSLKLFLEDLGHAVTEARTVAEAEHLFPSVTCDVLICDIGLPDGTGWDLLQKVKSHHCFYAVAMSGFGLNSDGDRSRAAGFRHHFLKPFKTADLERALEEAASEIETNERKA